jgi:hypothetical protein
MVIEKTKFVIATKSFPLMFENDECGDTDYIEDASFYDEEKYAEDELSRFDDPDTRLILPVKITYAL